MIHLSYQRSIISDTTSRVALVPAETIFTRLARIKSFDQLYLSFGGIFHLDVTDMAARYTGNSHDFVDQVRE